MNHTDNLFPHLPERLKGLEMLAENLWWSWNPSARMLFKMLDRQLWKDTGHNPDRMLREISQESLDKAAENADYLRHYDVVLSRFNRYTKETRTCFSNVTDPNEKKIAYFSAEYGLHHSLPFYAGGLGFLAGDFIKECSDIRVPLVAVGFMYPEGYLHQKLLDDGWQEHDAQFLNRDYAPITRVMDSRGNQLIVQVPLITPPLYVTVWKIDVGRVVLYLMDTDIEKNDPWNRGITARLYTGDLEQRLRQEIVLGIGGSEILEVMGIKQTILHLNEGHAAFAQLERIRDLINSGKTFEDALSYVRQTTVFTTHTPVPAGHDVFPFMMMEKYFNSYWPSLGIDREKFFSLGVHPQEPDRGFNMTAFAFRTSQYSNGVSRKHGEVTRNMWQSLWPGKNEKKIPIDYVTNGVHVPTWIDPKMELLFNRYLGPDWQQSHDDPVRWALVDEIPDQELWNTHYWLKIKLIDAVRERIRRRWANDRISPSRVIAGGTMLDPAILTIGFARRFAVYKRADLIFSDPDRLKSIINNRRYPVQIVFAGKAHPADDPGKRLLQKIFNECQNPDYGGRIAFVENYGEQLAQYLVHGVDIWLNTPLPPLEASGTSGMKAALNGIPSLSILDGWWIEGYNGKNGWAFGDAEAGENRHQEDAEALYRTIEEQIVPVYYTVSESGLPYEWVKIMKQTIISNAARFSARRMVKEYIEKFYQKAFNGKSL